MTPKPDYASALRRSLKQRNNSLNGKAEPFRTSGAAAANPMKEEKKLDPLPDSFETAEQAGEFWDTHSLMDYQEYLEAENGQMSKLLYIPFISYLRIAADAHARMIEYVNNGEAEDADFQNTAQGEATITVVFSTIALESFIHNYAARKLGEAYTDKHIEKMNLHTKWLLIPQLATGKAIPSDHRGIQLLKNLITARNSIVHLKAKNIAWERWDNAKLKIAESNRLVLESATTCFECIGLLGYELSELDTEDQATKLLASFSSTPKYRMVKKER